MNLHTAGVGLRGGGCQAASGTHWEEESPDYWNWNTDTRTTAIVLAAMARIEPDNPLVPYLKNLSHVINPIFYAFFLGAWVVIPWAIRTGRLRGRLWRGYPVPAVAVSTFFALNVLGNPRNTGVSP